MMRSERRIQLGLVEVILHGVAVTVEQHEAIERTIEKANLVLTSQTFFEMAGVSPPEDPSNCSGS